MAIKNNRIAVLCNYELLPDRVGGMDHFFWGFDAKSKLEGYQVDWFFPNYATHGSYTSLTIYESKEQSIENYFLHFCYENGTEYSHVITHFLELSTPFFYKIKKRTKAKIIAVDHNPRPLKGYPFKKKLEKRIKGILYSKYIDVFVGVSEYSKQALLKDFGSQLKKKITVVWNGLDVDKYLLKEDFTSNNKFIVVSHLRKEKGIQDLILALKNFKDYNFVIDIYGKGYYEGELKKMIHEFSLQHKIVFKGSVSNLHEIYCKYDYLIHPSHGETFCYSVVESLLSGVPVITTINQGNVLGLVLENENGFLFKEADVAGLSKILQNILTSKSQIDKSSIANLSQNISLTAMIENHFALLSNK
ncbi:glycosyltransferase family 4 protein [Flavobacterium faecale]|uniref:glycosyltransferase family 4 protein n=1 Tax=Flavobacterium faecale TaxID=1355330 RepID=UPI003AABD078